MIAPMSLRVGGWLGALAIVTVWWLVSLGDPPTARERSEPPAIATPNPDASAESAFTERLKRGLAKRPDAPRPRRNPFVFGSSEARPAPAAPPPPPNTLPPVAGIAAPAFTLAGIATSETADGTVRTAVVATGRGVILVKAGDDLPNGARVVRVEEDHIVVVDASGIEAILRLK